MASSMRVDQQSSEFQLTRIQASTYQKMFCHRTAIRQNHGWKLGLHAAVCRTQASLDLDMCPDHSRGTFHFHFFQGSESSRETTQTPRGNGDPIFVTEGWLKRMEKEPLPLINHQSLPKFKDSPFSPVRVRKPRGHSQSTP